METPDLDQRSNSSSRSFPQQPAENHHDSHQDTNSVPLADLDDDQPPPLTKDAICSYQNFSLPSMAVRNLLFSKTRPFQAQHTDILFVSKPKSGTTWFKALIFAIINREKYLVNSPSAAESHLRPHPLITSNPHELVPSLEFQILDTGSGTLFHKFTQSPSPRLYSTHLPYPVLPESIRTSDCKIVYLCRNPLDTLVSWWWFGSRKGETGEESSRRLKEAVDSFCGGVEAFGPHWDHVLGYWNQSLERGNKVLFMRYEEMKENQILGIKRLAEFVGCPFTEKEEEDGVIEEIAELCSFGSLKNLEVKQNGNKGGNSKFFRKGKVGDWVNHLTPSMGDRVKKVMEEKLQGTGLDVE